MDPEEALNAFFLLNDDDLSDLSDSGESDISDDDHLLLLSDGSSGDQSDSSSRTLSESSSAESEYSAFRQKFPKLWTSAAHSFLEQIAQNKN